MSLFFDIICPAYYYLYDIIIFVIIIELKEETENLSRCLSVDITVLDFKEEMTLVEYKKELEDQIVG